MGSEHAQRGGCASRAAPPAGLRRVPGLEFEADLAIRLPHEKRRERAARACRNELQEIGLAAGEQLLHLRRLDRPLQDHAPRAEIAGLVRPHGLLAHVGLRRLEYVRAALGTRPQRRLAREVRRRRVVVGVAEIERDFVGIGQFERCGKRTTQLAAESFQRTDRAIAQQRIGFGEFQLTAGHDLPEAEVAVLALEFLVLLVHFPAALRAAGGERAEIDVDRVVLVRLRLADDVLRHFDDLAHEIRA